jgi:hypothetical protein
LQAVLFDSVVIDAGKDGRQCSQFVKLKINKLNQLFRQKLANSKAINPQKKKQESPRRGRERLLAISRQSHVTGSIFHCMLGKLPTEGAKKP